MKKGEVMSEEIKKKISESHKGDKNPMWGKSLSMEHRKRLSEANKGNKHGLGYKHTEEAKRKISESESGDKHYAWKGGDVGYRALHHWVKKNLGAPNTCEHCGKSGFTRGQIGWANKSHEYRRDLTDWIRLCGFCHYKYDKIKKLVI